MQSCLSVLEAHASDSILHASWLVLDGSLLIAGMTIHELFKACRERFLVTNELALRGHLNEFRDHQLMQTRFDFLCPVFLHKMLLSHALPCLWTCRES